MYTKEVVLTAWNNGYQCFYDKDHPLATTDGRVAYHRHIASLNLGRWLTPDEHVHPINGDKEDNDISNLEVLTLSEHAKKHHAKAYEVEATCIECGIIFIKPKLVSKYCSTKCGNLNNIKNREITKKVLDYLIPTHSWVALGKLFNYSDKGIKKRAIALGCNIPVRKSTKPL
jgi:hypothetical protein